MTKFQSEQPIISSKGPRRNLARQVARWILTQPIESSENSPAPRGHIAGIHGGRGSGKTSFLYTFLEELRGLANAQASSATSEELHLRLPTVNGRDAIFRPAETRARDGLLMMVLAHLHDGYAPTAHLDEEATRSACAKIKSIEVERQDTARILDYLKDTSPSDRRLKDQYAETHFQVATGTTRLRRSFSELLELLTGAAPQGSTDAAAKKLGPSDDALKTRIILLIDDVDLQPRRALELLEILHLFLDQPQVCVLLAADKPLLIQAIDLELKRRDVHRPGLAAALLAKYVPYGWDLPILTDDDLGETLQVDLTPWWDPRALERALRPRTAPIIAAGDALRGVQPRTYRQLKALGNTLRTWEPRLLPGAPSKRPWEEAVVETFQRAIGARYNRDEEGRSRLGVLPTLAPAFLTLLASVDVQWPDLGVLDALEFEPDRLMRALEFLAKPANQQAPAPEDMELPILAALHDSSRFSPEQRGRARHALVHLANVLQSWRELNAESSPEDHFLFVSFYGDADAPQQFRSLWQGRLSDKDAALAHLDLREYAPDGRPSGEQVRLAADGPAKTWLADFRETRGRILLCAEAPLSFLIWLGHWLDHRRPVVAWNARDLRPLEVPDKLDPPDRAGVYDVCSVQWRTGPSRAQRAHVILDLLDRSNDDDHSAFPPPEEEEPAPPLECRLIYLGGSASVLDNADRILLDLLELLSELRVLGVTTLHLGLIMPDVMAFAVGRQLKSRGVTIVLYERMGARYQPSITLEG